MTSHLSTSCLLCDITTLHSLLRAVVVGGKQMNEKKSIGVLRHVHCRTANLIQQCYYCHVFQRYNRFAIISKLGQWAALYNIVDGINCNHGFAVKPMMLHLAADNPSTFSWWTQPWCDRAAKTFGLRVASLAYVNDSSPCRC